LLKVGRDGSGSGPRREKVGLGLDLCISISSQFLSSQLLEALEVCRTFEFLDLAIIGAACGWVGCISYIAV
jgi:hypothetical protein